MLWEIGVLIISIALLLFAIFSIPTLLQLRRTAKSMEQNSKTLNQNLPGILTNIDEITTNLTHVTQSIQSQVEGFQNVVDKIQDVADDVVQFERTIRNEVGSPLIETVATVTALIKGTRAFLDTLRSR
jgi:uncharacterized protein YoxC